MSNLYEINDFSGGMATVFPFLKMPPKYGMLLQNCIVSEGGIIEKIEGYTRINAAPVGWIKSGFEYRKKDGTVKLLSATFGTIYVHNGNATAQLVTGYNNASKFYFAQFSDKVVMGNGVDTPGKYDGAAYSNLGGLPGGSKFKKPHVHKGRCWWTDSANKMIAWYSALNAIEDYTTAGNAGYIDFSYILPQGDELLDIVTFIDLIVFFFRNYIVIYSGTNPTGTGDFKLVQMINGMGIIAPDAVTQIGTDLVFLHTTGLQSLKQSVATGNLQVGADISKLIHSDLTKYLYQFEQSPAVVCSMGYYQSRGLLFIETPVAMFVYSTVWKSWAKFYDGWDHAFFNGADGDMYLGTGSGYLSKYGGVWGFDGNPIEMKWDGPWMRLTRQGFEGFPQLLELTTGNCGNGINLDISVQYDKGLPMDENLLTVDSNADDIRMPLFGHGRTAQVSISNSSTAGPIEITSILIQGDAGGSL